MKVIYQFSESWKYKQKAPSDTNDTLVLSYNDWDDFGYKTALNASLYFNGELLLDFALKILIDGIDFTANQLNSLFKSHWDGNFPIPNCNYVSVPSDINFYSMLLGKIGTSATIELLILIRDASYLKNIAKDEYAIKLIETDGFNTSLLREAGARKSFIDGWLFFSSNEPSSIKDFTLFLKDRNNHTIPIDFKFNSLILPYDINILIGPNGIGKSHCLKSLVEYWLGVDSGDKYELDRIQLTPFDKAPNISRLILFSYSPFEEFTLDLSNAHLQDKDAYKYFGFRQNVERDDGVVKIGISRNLPAVDSAHSLLKAFADDVKYGFMPNWIGKIEAINNALKPTIGYDNLALSLNENNDSGDQLISDNICEIDGVKLLILNTKVFEELNDSEFTRYFNFKNGVIFIKNGKRIELSSGQKLYCYIVINLAGEIRKDSLVVIDEPELFLHLTLEVKFISLLKMILKAFSSKAILATHSLAIAREIPRNCVHVFRDIEDGLDIINPPFETFGADMQRIATYVFSDGTVTKPFDEWIESKLVEYSGNTKSLIDDLGKEINEETLITILNSGQG